MKGWISLLSPPGAESVPRRKFSVLKRKGRPFLYLPDNATQARTTLGLYPAQKFLARAYIGVLHFLLRWRIPLPVATVELPIDFHGGFGTFLKSCGAPGDALPSFGVLEGYGFTPESRCIMLLFDGQNRPGSIVKVGITPEAKKLILHAQDFFLPDGIQRPGVIEALDFYRGDDAYVIVYAYAEGSPPGYVEKSRLGTVLTPWINEGPALPMAELPQWSGLEELLRGDASLQPVFDVLRAARVQPVLSHGDFAVWNIRISSRGEWQVFDWERGQRQGIPAWDWFNYVVQYHLLVFHSSADLIVAALEEVWAEPAFLAYADRVGVRHVLKELSPAYLLYMDRYFPAGGTDALRRAGGAFRAKHFGSAARSRSQGVAR